MSKRIIVVTEGQSETNFIKTVLSEHFARKDIYLEPRTIVTSIDKRSGKVFKGGLSSFDKLLVTLTPAIKQAMKSPDCYVTTMIDFYKLPSDTPGFDKVNEIQSPYEKVQFIENEIKNSLKLEKDIFIPYIQLHEFEALLFSDISLLKDSYFEDKYDISPLLKCAEEISNPEMIDNGEDTAPSKRILKCIPCYNKPVAGVSVCSKIGVDKMRSKCSHFDEWLVKLENV